MTDELTEAICKRLVEQACIRKGFEAKTGYIVRDTVEGFLDRDRKMKAELATLLEDAERVTLTYWAKYPRWTVEQQLDKLAEECEEVARAIGDGESKDRQAEEISDVIFSALSMSHILNISTEKIEEALWHKLTIIQDRANKRTKLEAADSKTEASE